MQASNLSRFQIVLLGIGHTNAHVLRMWGMRPIPDADLICVARFPTATYSGMLPGVLAGQYPPAAMELDLVQLCARFGATLILGEVTGLDRSLRRLQFSDRASLDFDVLSIGIGSIPATGDVVIRGDRCLTIKPMQTLLERLRVRFEAHRREKPSQPCRIAVVGGGAAGAEISLCLPPFAKTMSLNVELLLVAGSREIPSGFASSTRKRVARELQTRGVEIILDDRVAAIEDDRLKLVSGATRDVDLVLWATQAAAPPLLSELSLAQDENGFLLVEDTLRVIGGDPIFVVGDTASIQNRPLAKCGVYAVRQGPILWDNIRRQLNSKPLRPFRPQRDFLKLLNLGDGRAIGELHHRAFAGKWVWRWKDAIDRRFMRMFQQRGGGMPTPDTRPTPADGDAHRMRCTGCGGKVGGNVLAAVLPELEIVRRPEVVVGLAQPDDAAVLRFEPSDLVSVTTDFFVAPLPDHYATGRIAALNAMSDIWAMGGQPVAALAHLMIPPGPMRSQVRLVRQLLEGSSRELFRAGVALVGGHTIEGQHVCMGFTVLGRQPPGQMATKSQLVPGDHLFLTKPLGTGVLLAGAMQERCQASWWTTLLETMFRSNAAAADLARKLSVRAMTDVTGFGLAGHLWEMLAPSGLSAQITLAQLPLLPGAASLWSEGLRSTMDESNRSAFEAHCRRISTSEVASADLHAPALFDPQTGGGLLMAVPPDRVEAIRETIASESYGDAVYPIGKVTATASDQLPGILIL